MSRRKAWVLDTDTKGTGAQMVPLERVLRDPDAHSEPLYVPHKRKRGEPEAPAPRPPRRFKVVDVATREVLGEDLDARSTVALLGDVRSMVDVNLYVWHPEEKRWRLLTLGEQRVLWDRRRAGRRAPARSA